MTLYVVSREAGPTWIDGASAFEQPAVDHHAAFMSELHDAGKILCAGPLAGTEHGRIRVLLIADAADEAEIRSTLAGDPCGQLGRIVTGRVEPWTPLVGAMPVQTGPPAPS